MKRAKKAPGSNVVAYSAIGIAVLAIGLSAFFVLSERKEKESGVSPPKVEAEAPREDRRVRRYSINLPSDQPLNPDTDFPTRVSLSPDGEWFVYSALVDGKLQLVKRRIDAIRGEVIPDTEGARRPIVSPDGDSIAFIRNSRVETISLGGGRPGVYDTGHDPPLRPYWSDDGWIYGSNEYGAGIIRARVGSEETETVTDLEGEETLHCFPVALPGGRGLIYSAIVEPSVDSSTIKIRNLETNEQRVVAQRAGAGDYLRTGHFIYSQAGCLVAMPFDPETLSPTGDPFEVTEDRMVDGFSAPVDIAVSRNGTLAYVPTGTSPGDKLELVLLGVDNGEVEPVDFPEDVFDWIVPSPDGIRLAYHTVPESGNRPDVWVYDLERKSKLRVTNHQAGDYVLQWSNDGNDLFFYSQRQPPGLYRRTVGETAAEELLIETHPDGYPRWFSPDGRECLFAAFSSDSGSFDIFRATVGDPEKYHPLIYSEYHEYAPMVSPNGKWLVYASMESGIEEVYVQSYPELGSKKLVSAQGGDWPIWSPDGSQIHYPTTLENEQRAIMAVDVQYEPEFSVSVPKVRFEIPVGYKTYRGHPDGKRVYASRPVGGGGFRHGGTEVIIVENWDQEVLRREQVAKESRSR